MKAKSLFCILLMAMILTITCGRSEETVKEELFVDTATISPKPGAYNYKPWIVMTKPGNAESGLVKVKGPNEAYFRRSEECFGAPYENINPWADCLQITESGTWSYFLESSSGNSTVTSVEFTIEPVPNNVIITASETPGGVGKSFEMTEIETLCSYDDASLEISIVMVNTDVLGNDSYVTFKAPLLSSAAVMAATINQDNSKLKAGIAIQARGELEQKDPLGTKYVYQTSENSESGVLPESQCTFIPTEINRGGVNKGTFTCTNLASDNDSVDAALIPLGKYLNLSGNWQCDGYRSESLN